MKFLFLFLLSLAAHGATYYVDYSGGSDANAGTSAGASFKRCPGDPKATGNSSSVVLAGGDTVIFKGGVTYVLTADYAGGATAGIALSQSGTLANRITYDGNSAGTFGTGKAILTDNNGTNQICAFYEHSVLRSNLVFKNFIIQKIGGAASLPTDTGSPVAPNLGGGIVFDGGVVNMTAQDCEVRELGFWFNSQPMDASSLQGVAFGFHGTMQGVLITNCVASRLSIGVEMEIINCDNFVISNCTFTNSLVWCVDIAPVSAMGTMDNTTISGCLFKDYDQFDEANWTGYGGFPHTDGIFHRCDFSGFTWGTNINFCYNTFTQTALTAGGTASIYITEGPSANVFNNLFANDNKSRAISLAGGPLPDGGPQVVRIYNNTFIGSFRTHIDWGDSGGRAVASKAGSLLSVKNNIFVDNFAGGANYIFFSASPTTNWLGNMEFDYNLYSTSNTIGNFIEWSAVTGDGGLTAMRAQGWEAHGLATGAQLANDFTPLAISPAVNAGTPLTSFFADDKNRAGRGAAWDIGAFKYVQLFIPQLNREATLRGPVSLRP